MSEIQLFAYYSLTEKLCMFIVEIDPQLLGAVVEWRCY